MLLKKKERKKGEKFTEKRKNEDKICLTSKRKKYNLGHNCKSNQSQKPQDKSKYDTIQIDSNKCLHKRDIAKNIKIKNCKRCAEKRKNEDKICLTGHRKKYNLGQNCKSSQSQTLLDKSAHDSTQINSNKCLH